MKKILYLFTLIALSVGLTCAQAASPTYDDNPPPSYIWGSGEINSQTSGTPNKNSDDKQVDVLQEVNVNIGSITVDTGTIRTDVSDIRTEVASMSSNLANAILSGSLVEQEVSYTVGSISVDTSNIESCLREDDKTVATLVNGIGTDTKNIENKLVATYTTQFDTYQRTVGEMLKNISQYYGEDSGSVNRTIFNIFNDLVMQYSSITSIEQGVSGLVKTSQPTIFKTTRLSSIAANTATQISPISVTGNRNRVFVELRAIDENALFYIGFDSSVTDSNGRPVKGRILINMPSSQNLYVYHTNSSAIDVQQTEGWR